MCRKYMKFLFCRRRYKEDSLLIHGLSVTALTLLGPKRTRMTLKTKPALVPPCVSKKHQKSHSVVRAYKCYR